MKVFRRSCGARPRRRLSTRGSILVALKRDEEALDAYKSAEALDPSIQRKLSVASHLLFSDSVGNAQEALEGLALALRETGWQLQWRGWAPGLRGKALVLLGQIDADREAWWEIVAAVNAPGSGIADCDLLLAEALIDERL